MKKHIIYIGLMCTFFVASISMEAQENKKNIKRTECSFSSHLGYSYMIDGIAGLSSLSEEYNDKLRSGIAWDLQFDFRQSRFTAGFLFSLYTSKGKTDYTSDRIFINYVVPQFGFYLLLPEQSDISVKMVGGIGYIMYRNNSRVFGNERKIKENFIGLNFGLSGIYRLSSHIGFSMEAKLIASDKYKFNVNYHGNTYEVNQEFPLTHISISAGINYIF
ncbi:MAG: hypothetical protein LBQ28_03450 [Prevotellaceae bacterium]|jgi:hypothetical protein|nr:hypothetical protein [Prevotellaceae bacterium]